MAAFTVTLGMVAAGCSLSVTEANDCTSNEECTTAFGTGFVCASSGVCEPSADTCESNADCRERNGVGSVCGADLVCEEAAANPRCERTYPEQLLTRDDRADFIAGRVLSLLGIPHDLYAPWQG